MYTSYTCSILVTSCTNYHMHAKSMICTCTKKVQVYMLWHFKTLNELRYWLFKPSSGDLRSACTASQPAARRDLMIFGEMWTDIARGSLTWLVNVNQYSYYSYYSFVVTYLDYSSLAIFVPSLATIPVVLFWLANPYSKNVWKKRLVMRC